jgi:thioredoxin reductase (NADPH)
MSHPRFVDGEVRVIGNRWSPRVHQLKNFLARSRVPFRWLDTEHNKEALELARQAAGTSLSQDPRFPLVIFPDGLCLQEPDVRTLAQRLGLDTEPDSRYYDLVVVGGGPAGLAASIHAASEGLHSVIVEQEVPGGQASYSAIVENYPGFPHALSGSELTKRTVEQAERFGVEIIVTRKTKKLSANGDQRVVTLDDETELSSHTVLLATGVSFSWLDAPGCPPLVGAGIYYGAAMAEAAACRGQDIYILGGGNSAAQAALLLSQFARYVIILTLQDSIEETMSKYLADRLRETKNIAIRTNHTVVGAEGEGHLEYLTLENVKTKVRERVQAGSLFVFIGALPQTDWLTGTIERDEEGFVIAGLDLTCNHDRLTDWPLQRDPYQLETSMPGVFVAGDVRKGSVKRIVAAAGEGAMATHLIHRYCAKSERLTR